MPFTLWPAQINVLWALMLTRLVIILKARQLGMSWLCCWYAMWLCVSQPGKTVLLFSKGQAEADELLRRIKVLYERLPDWLQHALPARIKDNTEEQAWANGSRVRSLPASPGSGRSFTASLVVLDEAAFLVFADQLYTALKPTIDAGGQLIVLSTANGVGNLFHQLWTRASAAQNKFRAIFLAWWTRPGRDATWYAAQLAEYTDPKMVKQEYPATAQEAFLVSGRARFASEWIVAQGEHLQAPLATIPLPQLAAIPGLALYALPRANQRVVIGADVSEGLEHGDYSAATLIDAETWDELGHLHGHWEPDEFARHLNVLTRAYNADLAIERNNHGYAVLATLKTLETPGVWIGDDGRAGWLTTAQSKPLAIDGLAVALRDNLVHIRTQATLNELQIYRRLANGGTSAPPGYHDDRVMTLAIAIAVAQRTTSEDGFGTNPFSSYRG